MATDNSNLPDIKDALTEYFKFKLTYENMIMANKKKIINNQTLSKREKRSEFLKLKPKCVNCKRPGGTVFKTLFHSGGVDSDSYREHIASCGIRADPCNFNIKIKIGKVELLPDLLNEMEREIKKIKNTIIDDKNKLLFGYLNTEDAVNKFYETKDEISLYTSLYEKYLETYNNIVDNEEKKIELNDSIKELYNKIDEIKLCIKRMNEENRTYYAVDAVSIYKTTVIALLEKIRQFKYNESFVILNEDTNTCNLIQNKYSINKMSMSLVQDEVMSFNVGYEGEQKKKPGLIIEDSSSSDEPVLIKKPLTAQSGNIIPEENPIYGKGSDGVSWKNPLYSELWERLPIKLKNALRSNNDWMKTFMYNCVNDRNNNKKCNFIHPENLKLPPIQLPNGKYDFGVDVYSDVFNNLPESVQKTNLTLYNTKENGVKDYSMLLDNMNIAVRKTTGFDQAYL